MYRDQVLYITFLSESFFKSLFQLLNMVVVLSKKEPKYLSYEILKYFTNFSYCVKVQKYNCRCSFLR